MRRVGVLALQGAFAEHEKALRELGAEATEVRLPEELEGLEGLIVPGGESTTIGKLAVAYGLVEPLRQLAGRGFPIWGTCAGMILLARGIRGNDDQPLIGAMDIVVRRNAFGRQVDSFECDLPVSGIAGGPLRAVFIRAPYITRVNDGVAVLAATAGKIVLARQGNLLAAAFHPELTEDTRIHRMFLDLVAGTR